MLFDTSSPGRKRAVQIIFASLAILMGGGLVLFGIGSSQSGGGLTDIVNNGGQSTLADQGKKDAESAQKALDKNPKDVAAAEKLARARFAIANEEAFDQTGNVIDAKAQALVTAADEAWTNYLKLAPAEPSRAVSASYSSFYAYPGVAQYDKAARALEVNLVSRPPSAGLYAQLAIYWLFGGSTEKYADARREAIKLAESDSRKAGITKQLDDYKKQYDEAIAAQAKQAKEAEKEQETSPSGTSPKIKTLPLLQ
ncbi:MAG: hypothetical protein Q7T55_26030 [Solirubrobacteraceae bacterium]|nr:hypothetical protein [Solirubrobacteraceae bacterium]